MVVRLLRSILVALLAPVLLFYWALGKLLVRLPTRKDKALAISLIGNALFAIVLTLSYYYGTHPELVVDSEHHRNSPSGMIPKNQGPLYFFQAAPYSELARAMPNRVYVAWQKTPYVSLTFADEDLMLLADVRVCDRFGRPWITAKLTAGATIYNLYRDAEANAPFASVRDEDGNGVPDLLVDWERHTSFVPEENFSWRPLAEDKVTRNEEPTE